MKWLLNMVIVCLSITATAQQLAVLETSGKTKTVFSCENATLYLTKSDENNKVLWKENYGKCDYTVKDALFWKGIGDDYIVYTLKDGVTDRMVEFDKNTGKPKTEYLLPEAKQPTKDQIAYLCRTARFYEKDDSENSIGFTYHKSLWEMAGAIPKVDPTEVGRAKVRKMWSRYKEIIRCEVGSGSRSEDLNIAKFAIDATNHRFASELVIAYKCDFNFVDKKDGMTLLDFMQERLDDQKRLTPPAEDLIRDYENLYRAIVRNGGKHAKDLTPEDLAR